MNNFYIEKSIDIPFAINDILIVKEINEEIFYFLRTNKLFKFNKKDFTFTLLLNLDNLGPKNTNIKYVYKLIDFNQNYIAYINKSSIYIHKENKIIKIDSLKGFAIGQISVLKLIDNNQIILGNIKGEVIVIDLAGKIIQRFQQLPDLVQDIIISDKFICIALFESYVYIFHKFNFLRINILTFLNDKLDKLFIYEDKLYVATLYGEIYESSIYSKSKFSIKITNNKIIDLKVFENKIIISPEYEDIQIYDSLNKNKLKSIYIKYKYIFFSEDYLFLIKNKTIYVLNKKDNEKINFPLIKDNEEELLNKFNFIKKSLFFNIKESENYLYSFWNESVKLSIRYIENSEFIKAEHILRKFQLIPEFKKFYNGVKISKQILNSYLDSIELGHYNRSYNLSNSYEFLKYTKYFKMLEKSFIRNFNKLLLGDFSLKIKQELNKYKYVKDKQDLIVLALHNKKIINTFKKTLLNKDYLSVNKILGKYKCLYYLPEYKLYLHNINEIFELRYYKYSTDLYEKINISIFKHKEKENFLKDFEEYLKFIRKYNKGTLSFSDFNSLNFFIYSSNEYKSYLNKFYFKVNSLNFNNLLNVDLISHFEIYSKSFFENDISLIQIKKYEHEIIFLYKKKDKRIYKAINLYIDIVGKTNFSNFIEEKLFKKQNLEVYTKNQYFNLNKLPKSLLDMV